MKLPLWVFVFCYPGLCVDSDMNVVSLRQAKGLKCQTFAIGETMTSASVLECFLKCAARYPTTCKSVVYNSEAKSCTPGSIAFGPLGNLENRSIPAVNSNDVIYYTQQPIPACNTTGGDFKLYEVCGVTACLHLNYTKATYAEALSNCSALNSGVFLGNTVARFSIFWHVGLNYLQNDTWFSVTDRAVEGTFEWENGDQVTQEQANLIWRPGYPNAWAEDEDCSDARHKSWPGVFGLNDEECWKQKAYMCEPYNAYFHW